jgi:putative DNA primase/helicase
LEQGTAPWQRPWEPGASGSFVPFNPITGKRYKGINALQLMSQERDDQRWLTYKQAEGLGYQVRKGERGTGIQYWKFTEEQLKKDEQGKVILDNAGNPLKVVVKLERPRVFYATVFNAEQIDGVPPLPKKEQAWDAIERAEAILAASGAVIHYNAGGRAYYRPSSDSIHLPEKNQFSSADKFYATALHELGHASGHPSRLDRDLAHPFGSEGYAKEELRAEIASMLLGDTLGIGHDPSQHAAYVGSWIKVLKDDPLEIFRAAADAERIHFYVLGLEQNREQQLTQNQAETITVMEAAMTSRNVAEPTALIPANLAELSLATAADYEKAAQWARLQEERIKNNPGSTAEALKIAREMRKTAELAATVNNESFQQKVTEFEQKLQEDVANNEAFDQGAVNGKGVKTYIQVPFKEKDKAKALGAKWDRREQSWYVPSDAEFSPFAKWAKAVGVTDPDPKHTEQTQTANVDLTVRQFLAVPYTERAVAKAAGARWDKKAKSWYAGDNADKGILDKWLPENVKIQQAPAMTTQEEFADALGSLGCIVNGEHPLMDGQTHRIATLGDKPGEKAGFYVAHLDGHPAGFVQNNRTSESLKWKSKGYSLSEAEKAQLQAISAAKMQKREAAQKIQQDRVANAVRKLLSIAPLASPHHPYLLLKQARPGDLHVVPEDIGELPAENCILIGRDRKESKALRESNPDKLVFTAGDLLLSAQDINGEIRTVQSIQDNGLKRFAAGGVKQDTFHVVSGSGLADLENSPAVVISEGYATADTLSQALGYATVAAFDSGNLPSVASLLRDKFPDKPFIIAGDNDLHQELTEGRNPGKEKAQTAANAVNGKAIFPIFATGEQAYPENLDPVTPAKARSGELTDGQKSAIAEMKKFSDFNDLATKSALGAHGVKRQIVNSVNSMVVLSQGQSGINQQHMHENKLEQQPVRRKAIDI